VTDDDDQRVAAFDLAAARPERRRGLRAKRLHADRFLVEAIDHLAHLGAVRLQCCHPARMNFSEGGSVSSIG
jgi:hypothetical protein